MDTEGSRILRHISVVYPYQPENKEANTPAISAIPELYVHFEVTVDLQLSDVLPQ
jgi:hypothetical protein